MITVCTIAKNEENLLPRMVGSLQQIPHIQEICILDTGSTDNTVQVALGLGARVETCTEFNDHTGNLADFASARNRNLQMAQTPWILMMDADDILFVDKDADPFLDWIRKADQSGWRVGYATLRDGDMRWQQTRMLRTGQVWYEGRVHEYPTPSYPRGDLTGMEIQHHSDKTNKEGSNERVLRILQPVPPHLRTPRDWFYLARSLFILGHYGAGADTFIEYLSRDSHFPEERLFARYYLACCYEKQGDRDRARKQIGLALIQDPRFAELHCYLGDLFFLDSQFDRARVCYETAIRIGSPPADSVLFTELFKYGPYPTHMLTRMGFRVG